ncbi:hypothetical protein TI03_00540 [Achromatium sp. WMS1]|nr:hypothetical protein TI03_00540 [Achromatium sp. WMS1]
MKNPFRVLPIDTAFSQGDILKQVTKAMRSGQHDVKQIADAQRILFDPLSRVAAEFIYRLNMQDLTDIKSEPTTITGALPSLNDPFKDI